MTLDHARFKHFARAACRALLCGVLAHGTPAHAQDFPDHWMAWDNHHRYSGDGVGRCGITRPMSVEWDRSLQQIAAQVAALAGPISPYGYVLPIGIIASDTRRDQSPNMSKTCARYPLEGEIDFQVWTEEQVDVPSAGAGRAKVKRGAAHAGAFGVSFNRLPELEGYSVFPSARMGFYRPVGTFQGFPAVSKRTILITAPGRGPAYVPVTLEAALKVVIPFQKSSIETDEQTLRESTLKAASDGEFVQSLKRMGAAEQQLQDFRRQMEQIGGMLRNRIAVGQAQLDGFQALSKGSPKQLAAPVYVKPPKTAAIDFELLTAPEEGAELLMMQNPAYFDDTLPRTTKQVMVIGLPQFDFNEVFTPAAPEDEKKLSTLWAYQIFSRADWKAIAAAALR